MKKLIILILVITLLSGCTIVRIDTESIDNIISVVLSKQNNLYNRVGKGYKYYVPKGVSYIDTNDLNEKLYSEGYYYYLYIDAISYYHSKKLEYVVKEDIYFSKKLEYNGKEGYLEIKQFEDYYFVEFMYNYAKIEAIVPKDKIETVILNSSYILSTVKFNNNVIELMLDDTYFTDREEVYDIFSAKDETDEGLGRQWLETADDENNIDGGE